LLFALDNWQNRMCLF